MKRFISFLIALFLSFRLHALSYDSGGGAGSSVGATVSGGTIGSVLFVGSGGVLRQDNSNLFWDDTQNFLGVGTASPDSYLTVGGGSGDRYMNINGGSSSNSTLYFSSIASPDAQINKDGSDVLNIITNTGSGDITFKPNTSQAMVIKIGGNVGIGTASPSTKLDISSGTITANGTGSGMIVGTHRVGAIEMQTETNNILVQIASASVTGTLAVDFTDSGLKDYGAAPFVIVSPVFNSSGDNLLECNAHTISTTGLTLECVISSGDGVGQTTAADASARQVNYMLSGTAP